MMNCSGLIFFIELSAGAGVEDHVLKSWVVGHQIAIADILEQI